MTRSEALFKLQNILMELDHSQDAEKSPEEQLLESLLMEGFPIPCNKKGKFEWDQEDKNESSSTN